VTNAANEERELKFVPDAGFDLGAVLHGGFGVKAEECETTLVHAVYYDTADFKLTRAGASLRHRDSDGWTIKLPQESDVALVRTELHIDGPPGDPPAAALDLVHALARHAPVRVAARLDSERHRYVLRDDDGEMVGELVDDRVSVHSGVGSVDEFRELEVEFRDDVSSKVVDQIAEVLRDAGAGEPQHTSKIARALGPRAMGAPDLTPPADLDFASTPSEVLRASIARSTARLVAHDPGVRLGSDAEAVHQARVATRRLRSDLRTFRQVLDPEWDEALRAELKWLGGLLGAVRDTDVLLARLEARVGDLGESDRDAGERLLQALRDERAQEREALLGGMRSKRYVDLLERLLAATRAVPASTDGADFELDLGDLVVKPWKKLCDAVHDLGDEPTDPELHQVRIRAKRARYAAEAVVPAIGKGAKRFAKAVADLQDVLGEHQDAVVAGEWLRQHAPADDSAAAFVAGELAVVEAAAAQASREGWLDTWRTARRPRLRRWM
jgi:CHAD domain-containing protein